MIRRLLDASLGRRLVFRIWAHGLALFASVIAMVWIARWAMPDLDATLAMRAHPYVAAGVAERALAFADDRASLDRELQMVEAETPLHITVFAPDGTRLAGAPSASLPAADVASISPDQPPARWTSDRLLVGRFRDGSLTAFALVRVPEAPSKHAHLAAIHIAALVLAFLLVALPLSRAIARPIEQLGDLARQLGGGNLAVRAHSTRRDEIGDLSRSFDTMAGQIEDLRAAERQLLGDVSHELRTPLARMHVVLDLASDSDIDSARRYLHEITTDLRELEQLVDDIIVSLRLDHDGRWAPARPPIRRCPLSVDELVEASIGRFADRWPERALEHSSVRDLVVDGDAAMLRRVLDNLLDNAQKFSPAETPISVEVAKIQRDTADVVRIEVVDRGIGIEPEDQQRVFSPFFRADRSRTRSTGGVGLGLVLARRIVEAHGGTIGFASEPHRGSRFWFELALHPAIPA